jgi:LacI family transcriptional regulator
VDCNAPALFRALHEARVAFVQQTFVQPRKTYDFPDHCRNWVDKAEAMSRAVEFLVQLGHTHIAYAGRGYSESPRYWLREQAPHDGFLEGMRRSGLVVRPEFDQQLVGTREKVRLDEAFSAILSGARPPTAVLCSGDWVAIRVIELARERGLRVPRDLSVVGMNDEPDAARHDPPLTTMRIPSYEQTCASIHVLADPAREPWREPFEIVQTCDLVVRGTTAPPGRG